MKSNRGGVRSIIEFILGVNVVPIQFRRSNSGPAKLTVLAIFLWGLASSSASATILPFYDPIGAGLEHAGTTMVTDSFYSGRPAWHSLSGAYSITSGDTLSLILGTVRGASGSYLRALGEDCSNLFPGDCDASPGVWSVVDLAAIAGPASAYDVLVSLDVVAEGDMDGRFEWTVQNIGLVGGATSGDLQKACIKHDFSGNCLTYAATPVLDYSAGPQTEFARFWVVDDSDFTQKFFSNEPYGFWAVDGYWGIDNLSISITSYAESGAAIDSPPIVNVMEPSTFVLLGAGLIGLGWARRY